MLMTLLPLLLGLLDRIIPDEDARAKSKLELMRSENQQILNEMEASLSAIVAEGQSQDPWTSRARPSFLYVMYVLLLACFAGGILGIWWPAEMQRAADNIHALLKAIPSDLYSLFGLGYLGYAGARSFDKWTARR